MKRLILRKKKLHEFEELDQSKAGGGWLVQEGYVRGEGKLNKAAGYRPCLNWDSAKFQLPCNWRNVIMSRVKGP